MNNGEEFRRRNMDNLIRYMPTVLAGEMNIKHSETENYNINTEILEEIENYFKHLSRIAHFLVDEKEFETFLSTVSQKAPKSVEYFKYLVKSQKGNQVKKLINGMSINNIGTRKQIDGAKLAQDLPALLHFEQLLNCLSNMAETLKNVDNFSMFTSKFNLSNMPKTADYVLHLLQSKEEITVVAGLSDNFFKEPKHYKRVHFDQQLQTNSVKRSRTDYFGDLLPLTSPQNEPVMYYLQIDNGTMM